MQQWGGYLFFFGVGSVILSFFNMEFIILSWIDLWGPNIGWTIRIAMIVVGSILWLVGRSQNAKTGAGASSP